MGWSESIDREVGVLVHRVIGELAGGAQTVATLSAAVRAAVQAHPVAGVKASGVRLRVAAAAGTYLRRFRPDAELIGVEVAVGDGIADLVWRHGSMVVIDELKSGSCDVSTPAVKDQLERLCRGGSVRWGGDFVGVRFVPLMRPQRAVFLTAVAAGLVQVAAMPAWLEVK